MFEFRDLKLLVTMVVIMTAIVTAGACWLWVSFPETHTVFMVVAATAVGFLLKAVFDSRR